MELRRPLRIPLKPYVFNLWLSTKNVGAPNLATDLIRACGGTTVNWVVMGCVGAVTTNWYSELKRKDIFGVETNAERLEEQIVEAVKIYEKNNIQELSELYSDTMNFEGMVEALYNQFDRWAERFGDVSPMPTPIPQEPPKKEPPADEDPQPEPDPEPGEEPSKKDSGSFFFKLIGIVDIIWDVVKKFVPVPALVATIVDVILNFIVGLRPETT